MPRVEKINALIRELKRRKEVLEKEEKIVQVGYSQSYALYVHENLSAGHKPGKEAKYLQNPARQYEKVLASIIHRTVLKTGSVQKGLLLAGLRLQRESQKIVPIDTGALRASAYTSLESQADIDAAAAYAKSEAIRQKELARRKAKAAKKRSKRKRK